MCTDPMAISPSHRAGKIPSPSLFPAPASNPASKVVRKILRTTAYGSVRQDEAQLVALLIQADYLDGRLELEQPFAAGAPDVRRPAIKDKMRAELKRNTDYHTSACPTGELVDLSRRSHTGDQPADQERFAGQLAAVGGAKMPRFVALRVKSTNADPTAQVKQTICNTLFTPYDATGRKPITFKMMATFKMGSQVRFGCQGAAVSQDTSPSPLPIASLSKCYYSYCTTSDVYTTPVSTTVVRQLYGSNYRILQYGSVVKERQARDQIAQPVLDAAVDILPHTKIANRPVAMVTEIQYYIRQFLERRKLVHIFYKIARTKTPLELVKDFAKCATGENNSKAMAYQPPPLRLTEEYLASQLNKYKRMGDPYDCRGLPAGSK